MTDKLRAYRQSSFLIKVIVRGHAEYRGHVKRGTKSLFASENFSDIRERYSRKVLRSSFFGPREWYHFAQKKMKETGWKDAIKIAADIASIYFRSLSEPPPYSPLRI
jgi:hypothetical protein